MSDLLIRDDVSPAANLGGCLLLGLLLCGWTLGAEIKRNEAGRPLCDGEGLVERTVKADRGSWSATFKEAGDDLRAVYRKSTADKTALLAYFNNRASAPLSSP